jgi:GTP-binding protein
MDAQDLRADRLPESQFIVSAAKPLQFPETDRPEIAFAGRSNVGKSSLLNRLLNRRRLARTSSTPGRTQTINFFAVGHSLYFVDLPGFGYAKVPLAVRASWGPMVNGYLTAARDLRLVILLVDIRREPGEEEIGLLDWLKQLGLNTVVVVTKADKIKRGPRHKQMTLISRSLQLVEAPVVFSSVSGEGRDELWDLIIEACRKNHPPVVEENHEIPDR